MLVSTIAFTLTLATCAPQGSPPLTVNQAAPPVGLTVVVVDVGQGDGVVLKAPDGTVHVVDAGPEGQGFAAMVPTINSLSPSSYGYTVLSHFHTDHEGGLDDVLNTFPFQVALDRGDQNRASNQSINDYLSAAGGRRQTIAVGATYQLGGGATMTCICANGSVMGGGYVNPAQNQEENARSVALRVDYGDFSMWLGGDLTGGGSSTADIEGPATLACGDVDVYKLNHHGSNTSTSVDLVTRLDPELAIASCGDGNSYGHPTTTITNRLNQAQAVRALLSTSEGSANVIGFGVTGDVRIDTDGFRYRATAENGDFLDFYCDEVVPAPMSPGDVRISEVHRNPSVVADTNGEYVEVVNIGSKPVALSGLRLGDNSGSVTLAANYMLVPGRPMIFQLDGAPARNGGLPMGCALPYSSLAFGNSSDVVTVEQGATLVDSLSYTSSWPGGSGVACERVDLLGANTAGNYAASTQVYGAGDRGTPGELFPGDATAHPVQVGVDVYANRVTLHANALDHGGSTVSVIALSMAAAPGFWFGGSYIPLMADQLFSETLGQGGLLAWTPVAGYRSLNIGLPPSPSPLTGTTLYAAHVVLDLNLQVPGVSAAVPFVLP